MYEFSHLTLGGGGAPASILNSQLWNDIDELRNNVPQDDVLAFFPDTQAEIEPVKRLVDELRLGLDREQGSFAVFPLENEDGTSDLTVWSIHGTAGSVHVYGYAILDQFGYVLPNSPLVATGDYPRFRVGSFRYAAVFGSAIARQARRIVGDHLTYLAGEGRLWAKPPAIAD